MENVNETKLIPTKVQKCQEKETKKLTPQFWRWKDYTDLFTCHLETSVVKTPKSLKNISVFRIENS